MNNIKLLLIAITFLFISILNTNAQSISFVETTALHSVETNTMVQEEDAETSEATETSNEKVGARMNQFLEVNLAEDSNPNFFYKILGVNDKVIYSGSLHNTYSLKFDTKKLLPGKYFLNIENKEFFISKAFIVSENIKA